MGTKAYMFGLMFALWLSSVQAADANKPTIVQNGRLLLGSNYTLRCLWSGGTPAGYEWLKDNRTIAGEKDPRLSLHNVTHSAEGWYSCRVFSNSTAVWTASDPVLLSLIILPNVSIKERTTDKPYRCAEYSTLNLTCKVLNQPQPPVRERDFSWTFCPKGNVCSSNDSNKVTESSTLAIIQAQKQLSGIYTCLVSNTANLDNPPPPSTASIDVEVFPPYLADNGTRVRKEGNETVVAGNNVTLTCQADSVPTANLTWLRKGHILRIVESNENVYSFPATGCQDSGEYQCRAYNDAVKKHDSAKIELIVECPPTLVKDSTPPPGVTGHVGDNVTLTVSVTAHPAPSFVWSGPGLSSPVPQSASLTLYNLQPQQAGIYTVTVSNCHGFLTRTFILDVQERPQHTASVTVIALSIATALALTLTCICASVCVVTDERFQKYIAKKTKGKGFLRS